MGSYFHESQVIEKLRREGMGSNDDRLVLFHFFSFKKKSF